MLTGCMYSEVWRPCMLHILWLVVLWLMIVSISLYWTSRCLIPGVTPLIYSPMASHSLVPLLYILTWSFHSLSILSLTLFTWGCSSL